MIRRFVGALAIFVALIAPAAAQNRTPAEIVEALYANPETPPLYSIALADLFAAEDRRRESTGEIGNLDFDWVSGGQDDPRIDALKIETISETEAEASVRASFRNYSEERSRLFHFVRRDRIWAIDDVELEVPEGGTLSSILRGG